MSTSTELKKLLQTYLSEYQAICEQSRTEKMGKMNPGEPVPIAGTIYGNDFAARFDDVCGKLRAEAEKLLQAEKDRVKLAITEAPDPAAVNTIMLLNTRSAVTEAEIMTLLEKYGGNYQTREALRDIANKHSIWLPEEDDVLMRIGRLEKAILDALTRSNADTGHATPGYFSLLRLQIDDLFGAE